jgi:hypothetical protein
MKMAMWLVLAWGGGAALANTFVLRPGERFLLSPYDEVVCQQRSGTIYDYCACANLADDGWTVMRYRKISDGYSETLLQDKIASELGDQVSCNQKLISLPVCQSSQSERAPVPIPPPRPRVGPVFPRR